jgi:N-acyl-L-homoserine lactone synthetase
MVAGKEAVPMPAPITAPPFVPQFGSARAGSSNDIIAAPGIWADEAGRANVGWAAGASTPLARAMLRDRKRVFIDQLHWQLDAPDGQHEIDGYDRADTLYLLAHQPGSGRHLGSVRLLPSTGPHLLADHFAHLCAGPVPRGPDVWEITRLVTAPGLSRAEALQVRRQLALALFDQGLALGVTRYTMVTHMPWVPALLSIGWDAEPLGMPHGSGSEALCALAIRVDAAMRDRLASAWAMADVRPPAPLDDDVANRIGAEPQMAS